MRGYHFIFKQCEYSVVNMLDLFMSVLDGDTVIDSWMVEAKFFLVHTRPYLNFAVCEWNSIS